MSITQKFLREEGVRRREEVLKLEEWKHESEENYSYTVFFSLKELNDSVQGKSKRFSRSRWNKL